MRPSLIKIPLTKGRFAEISGVDAPNVLKYKWYCSPKGYAKRTDNENRTSVFLHRFILNPNSGIYVDHKDGNKLNCQRSNLRLCSLNQNQQNKPKNYGDSGYKGVCLSSNKYKKWRAYIYENKIQTYLGSFLSAESAAREYDREATKRFGEFALLNFKETEK